MIVRNVVAVIAQRGREEGHQPDCVDPELLQIIQFLFETSEVADAIAITVVESANVHLVDDRVFVPKSIRIECQTACSWGNCRYSRQNSRYEKYMG